MQIVLEFILNLPLWQMIRYGGVISYCLLTLGMCLGIVYSFPVWKGKTKATIYKWHMVGTISGTAIGLFHGMTTVIDTFMPFTWKEVLIPFAASKVWYGFGTLAGYGMLFLVLTTDLRNKLGRKVWLTLHLLSYPVFVMALVHGYFSGSDSAKPGIQLMYMLSILLIVVLTYVRGNMTSAEKNRQRGQSSKKAVT